MTTSQSTRTSVAAATEISNVLLLGVSGIPGRNILASLINLKQALSPAHSITITILKRSDSSANPLPSTTATTTTTTATTTTTPPTYTTTYVQSFTSVPLLTTALSTLSPPPSIIVSALNAEPSPTLDNNVISALVASTLPPSTLFINGYTLDLLHPIVSALPETAQASLQGKIAFAERLRSLAAQGTLRYVTLVNAAFLDYCLVKGYSGVDVAGRKARLVDGGSTRVTGCSLRFVGDVVAELVRIFCIGDEEEEDSEEARRVVNQRLRIAEAVYSGRELVRVVEELVGEKFEITVEKSSELLDRGSAIGFLNWVGWKDGTVGGAKSGGASDFSEDGFRFGGKRVARRSLEEIYKVALEGGREAFEGVGR